MLWWLETLRNWWSSSKRASTIYWLGWQPRPTKSARFRVWIHLCWTVLVVLRCNTASLSWAIWRIGPTTKLKTNTCNHFQHDTEYCRYIISIERPATPSCHSIQNAGSEKVPSFYFQPGWPTESTSHSQHTFSFLGRGLKRICSQDAQIPSVFSRDPSCLHWWCLPSTIVVIRPGG